MAAKNTDDDPLPAGSGAPDLDLGEDEDVVWAGSPLHEHLVHTGFDDIESGVKDRGASSTPSKSERCLRRTPVPVSASLATVTWPRDVPPQQLEIDIAKKLLSSELMVEEDEDFITNFILTEDALASSNEKKKADGARSFLGDALLFSGSLVAVAGTVLYLTERTRLAATAAAVLPTALAALAAAKEKREEHLDKMQEEQFLQLIEQMLVDMKTFKHLVRKSLNLLQGMELMHSGYLFAVNSATGAPQATTSSLAQPSSGGQQENPLSSALEGRACFPALRKATYECTVEMILAYRDAVTKLLDMSPLADRVDL